jgi:rhodanese-related sulfurtransferase
MSHTFLTDVAQLLARLGAGDAPQIIDVRLPDDRAAFPTDIPGSIHREEAEFDRWRAALDPSREHVIVCHRGYKVSQAVAARLRAAGLRASTLVGGAVAWAEAGAPVLDRAALLSKGIRPGGVYVTRRRPKIDRAACPWLIRRFIDPEATFLFVEPDQVVAVAARTGGVPYDIPDAPLSHVDEDCSFDTILKVAGLAGFAPLARLAAIVRGADNHRFDLAPEAAGLLAVSLGLSAIAGDDDHVMLAKAFAVYDALYAWARFAADETHNLPPRMGASR